MAEVQDRKLDRYNLTLRALYPLITFTLIAVGSVGTAVNDSMEAQGAPKSDHMWENMQLNNSGDIEHEHGALQRASQHVERI